MGRHLKVFKDLDWEEGTVVDFDPIRLEHKVSPSPPESKMSHLEHLEIKQQIPVCSLCQRVCARALQAVTSKQASV